MDVKLIARLIKVSEKDVQKWILEDKADSKSNLVTTGFAGKMPYIPG